ncbi:MAG: response regulator [Cyclobacteriaceae bacterium]
MKKKILTVDDSESIVSVVTTTLEEDYDMIGAFNAKEALEHIENTTDIQLIITDLNMPGMDGIELIRKVRSIAAYQFTPILMLTTESQLQKKQEAKEAGATGWIIKPFETDKLRAVVQKVLR